MRAVQEFSRFASYYDQYNIIQKQVAKRLVEMIHDNQFCTIMDIGCGSGAVFRELVSHQFQYQTFWALDFSEEMLSLHPHDLGVVRYTFNFNDPKAFETLPIESSDLILSSSALQWSSSLNETLKHISRFSKYAYFAIFTSGTFATLHSFANLSSPIYSVDEIKSAMDEYYTASYEKVTYQLAFDDVRSMLQYIKKSGVSGGNRQLSYAETKRIICKYPYNYLEFEVLFISASSRRYNSK